MNPSLAISRSGNSNSQINYMKFFELFRIFPCIKKILFLPLVFPFHVVPNAMREKMDLESFDLLFNVQHQLRSPAWAPDACEERTQKENKDKQKALVLQKLKQVAL